MPMNWPNKVNYNSKTIVALDDVAKANLNNLRIFPWIWTKGRTFIHCESFSCGRKCKNVDRKGIPQAKGFLSLPGNALSTTGS